MEKLFLTMLALPIFLMTSTSVNAIPAGVDCNKDTLFVRTICNDEEFSKLFDEVHKELGNTPNIQNSDDLINQRNAERLRFNKNQRDCNDKECLKKVYEQYIEQLISFNAKAKKIPKEKDDEINFKDLQLGMNKDAIPSKIKLIKDVKMSDYDQAFRFNDGNNNKINIYGMSFDVSFIIKGDNTVKAITYTAKEAKNINETTLVELGKIFTSKPLKKMTMNNYENGLLSSINLSNTDIKSGIKDDFRVIYYNENSPASMKNEVIIQRVLEPADADEKIMKAAIDKAVNDIYITVEEGGILCLSVNSYKKLIDYVHKEPGSYSPSDCNKTKEGQFVKSAAKESYRGINIIEVMGDENKFYWVSDTFLKQK